MRTTAAGWVKTMGILAQAEGVDANALFAEVGLNIGVLLNPYARVAQDTITRLWGLLVQQTGDAAIGLKFGKHVTPATFSAVGYVMLSCQTVKDSLQQLTHYQRYLGEGMRCNLIEADDHYRLSFEGVGDQQPVSSQTLEAKLSACMHYARWVTRGPVVPLQVFLRHDYNADPDVYTELFLCPVQERAEFNGFLLPKSFVEQELPSHDPVMLEQHRRMANEMISHSFNPFSVRVKGLMREWLPVGEATQKKVADALTLTTKTLQRRLQEEGTAFSTLLDECREEAACAYLLQPSIELVEIADLAGFADYSSFAKFFKRRTGMPPSTWRASKVVSC